MNIKHGLDLITPDVNTETNELKFLPTNRTQLLTNKEKLLYLALNQTNSSYEKDKTIPEIFFINQLHCLQIELPCRLMVAR